MEALNIISEIMKTCSLSAPRTIENGQDSNTALALACANRALRKIAGAYDWQELRRNIIFKASSNHPAFDAKALGFDIKKLAPDFNGIITVSLYENGSYLPIEYLSADKFLKLKVTGIGSPLKYFTAMGGKLLFLPVPTAEAYEVSFVYKSKWAVVFYQDGAESFKPYFTKDSDECVFDEELIVLGGICALKQQLRLDYADDLKDWEICLEEAKNRNIITPVISPQSVNAVLPDNPALSARRDI